MYGKIIIKTSAAQVQLRTNAHDSIYDFLIERGYRHDEAAEVAAWAEIASVGEEYELHDSEIVIVE